VNDLIGKTISNRYQIKELLGRGGMAEVYKVWDTQRSTTLALKLLYEDLAIDRVFIRRFKREAQTLAQLQHPNIVRFYGFEQEGDFAFMLLDYIQGRNLKRVIYDTGGPMPLDTAAEITNAICGALNFAHGQGYIHCDLKPGNILFDDRGTPMLADFGIARMTGGATATLVGAGTPAYMSPEQVKGLEPTPQTDIYALGIILFEMLTGGERPFTGEQTESTGSINEMVRWEQVNLSPPSPQLYNPELPDSIAQVVLTCLAKDPRDRYLSALAVSQALEKTLLEMNEETKDQAAFNLQYEAEGAQSSPQAQADQLPGDKAALTGARKPKTLPLKPVIWVGLGSIAILIGGLMISNGNYSPSKSAVPAATNFPSTQQLLSPSESVHQPSDTPMPTETPLPTMMPTEVLGIGSEKISLQGKMTMVYVPEGEFEMGSDWEDLLPFYYDCKRENDGDWCEQIGQDEKPKHTVYLDAYWIDKTEVTNAMYAEFLNEVGNQYLDGDNFNRYLMNVYMIEENDGVWEAVGGYEDHPVKSVAWQGALDYCHWAGRRLPTEAEWEKAARGTDGRTYPWGEEISCDYVNYKDCVRDTTPVGSYPEGASPYGALDMGGNVAEWVSDRRDPRYYQHSPLVNPQGPDNENRRVIRGGSWSSYISFINAFSIRTATRQWGGVKGFRCAVSEEVEEDTTSQISITATPNKDGQQSRQNTQSSSNNAPPASGVDETPTPLPPSSTPQPTTEPTNTPRPPSNTPPPPTFTAACPFDDPNWPCND